MIRLQFVNIPDKHVYVMFVNRVILKIYRILFLFLPEHV